MRTTRLMVAATAVLAVAAMGIGAASAQGPAGRWGWIDDARMKNAAKEPQNWLMHSGDTKAWRYSGLDQITPAVNHCHEPPAIGPTALVGKPRVNGPLMAR